MEPSNDPKNPSKNRWWREDPSDPSRWTVAEVFYNTTLDKADAEPRTHIGVYPKNDDERDWRGVRRKDIQVLPMPPPAEAIGRSVGGFKNKYYLFDTPDYADPFSKLWWTLRYSFIGSAGLYSFCVGTGIVESKNMWKFISKYTLYSVGVCMITTSSAILIANLRGKKDDWRNWTSGAFVAALWLGNLHGWPAWWKGCIYGMPAAMIIKRSNEANIALLNRHNHHMYSTRGIYGASCDKGWRSGDLRFGYVRNFVERARRQM